MHITVLNGEESIIYPSHISRHYNQSSDNLSARISRTFSGTGSLITVISIGKDVKAEKVPVMSNYFGRELRKDYAEGVRAGEYLLVLSHWEWGSPTDSFSIEGHNGWGQSVVFKDGDKDIGTVLEY